VESFKTLGIALMLSIFLVYVVMGSQFNSFVQPFIISFTIPLAIVGVILILWLTGTPLNLNSFLGGVVLAGIVVNNGILLVDFMNRKRRTMEFKAAVIEGAALRLRPILMTALTTILGMLPLALGWGEGSESLAPLARSVVGGLTVSTFTTLLVIPALYVLITPRQT
jgi:HAE1 family hydrophobic/amphiphilic exporter-1